MQGCRFPDVVRGFAGAAFVRWNLRGDDVEPPPERLKGLVLEKCVNGCLGVVYEHRHFVLSVALSHKSQMNAMSGVVGLLECLIWCHMAEAYAADENVGRRHHVGHLADHLAPVVHQHHAHIDGVAGHGNKEHVLERALNGLGLVVGEPFLKQSAEGVAIDDGARAVVSHNNLAVAIDRHFAEVLLLAIPSGHHVELVKVDVLVAGVARKHIVET